MMEEENVRDVWCEGGIERSQDEMKEGRAICRLDVEKTRSLEEGRGCCIIATERQKKKNIFIQTSSETLFRGRKIPEKLFLRKEV